MSEIALNINDLCLNIGGKKILEAVSFEVQACEFLSIVGPNGAGKTTLLKCIGRLLNPNSGSIELFGRAHDSFSRRELARQISYVPQAGTRSIPYSVFDFVLMARYPYFSAWSSDSAQDRQAVVEALELTETVALAERDLDTLSGGERQIVFIAAALAQGADILLLDEPTTFLDYGHQVQVLRLINRLHREQGKTVIMVTHELNKGVSDSDHVLALKDGRVAFFGTPNEFLTADNLGEIYDTAFDVLNHPESGAALVFPKRGA